ncbi:FAD-dependent oxidoreductase [Sulfodiicoccus acidiphilus]|uniref:FAD-dependent oxidoreductase n=1 Tax=Sulfodiicoccus acidiphilus TaxID=1670455 RepID=A0A348B2V4_9CREN|nr:FAD-binding oxidoreductase [Sulfodiicoccus acidiphilus]BBD72506.1 FAD-dependent oxidoreductase [Sulfodiicoccus acidiphilus]GGT94052.1 FAD-dependent oxidoreductase [Sulfodiicoccus acidiphilus]
MIVIVGAGGHGLSAAYHLLKRGVKNVVIIEAKRVGYGSSSRNISRYRVYFNDKKNVEFARKAMEFFSKESKELKFNTMFMRTGYLWILGEGPTEGFRRSTNLWDSEGLGGKYLDCNNFNFLKEGLGECYFGPLAGSFHHDYLTLSYYEEVRKVHTFLSGEVTQLLSSGGKVKGVVVEGRQVQADTVLITAGAWTSRLLSSLGLSIPIVPERKEAYITEDVKFKVKPLVIDLATGVYFSHTLKGEIIGGIDRGVQGFVEFSISLDNMLAYLKRLRHLVRGIEGIGLMRGWSGFYEMTPDRSHVMGFDPQWPEGLFIDAGYSGHGMMMSPLSGEIMAKMIVDGKIDGLAQPFTPERFRTHKLLEENMVI